jgi:hypothetical protein
MTGENISNNSHAIAATGDGGATRLTSRVAVLDHLNHPKAIKNLKMEPMAFSPDSYARLIRMSINGPSKFTLEQVDDFGHSLKVTRRGDFFQIEKRVAGARNAVESTKTIVDLNQTLADIERAANVADRRLGGEQRTMGDSGRSQLSSLHRTSIGSSNSNVAYLWDDDLWVDDPLLYQHYRAQLIIRACRAYLRQSPFDCDDDTKFAELPSEHFSHIWQDPTTKRSYVYLGGPTGKLLAVFRVDNRQKLKRLRRYPASVSQFDRVNRRAPKDAA